MLLKDNGDNNCEGKSVMKAAAIDMGTNSARLLIAEYIEGKYKVSDRGLITTRLGEGVDKSGFLQEKAISRGVKAVKKFKNKIDSEKVKEVAVIGTSALRDVDNADIYSDLLKKETGYKLKIVSGSEEARLIYQGVSLDFKTDNLLIIDIGGGSTEFIWQDSKVNYKSLNIGAVRMTERYITDSDRPLQESKYKQIYNKISEELNKLNIGTAQPQAAGVGGTITTLGAIDQKLTKYDSNKIHGYRLKLAVVKQILNELKNKTLAERKDIAGLQPERADIITAGTIILAIIMEKFKLDEITVSENDILFGIAREICE